MTTQPETAILHAVREGITLWVECKSATGRLSAAQEAFRADVESHGGTYVVARSVDDLADLTGGCLALDGAR